MNTQSLRGINTFQYVMLCHASQLPGVVWLTILAGEGQWSCQYQIPNDRDAEITQLTGTAMREGKVGQK